MEEIRCIFSIPRDNTMEYKSTTGQQELKEQLKKNQEEIRKLKESMAKKEQTQKKEKEKLVNEFED